MKKARTVIIMMLELIILIFILWYITKLFMPKYINENQDGRITQEFYDEKLDNDIIFVGSSLVYYGISPTTLWREYGITSYDRANASQTMWISYYMIKDAIATNKPQMVVLDVSFMKNEDEYVEEVSSRKALDNMRFSLDKIECIKETMGEDEHILDYLFPLFRYHSRWKELSAEDFANVFNNKPVTFNGQIINKEASPDFVYYDRLLEDNSGEIGNRNINYLRKIIELCKSENIKIMLIKTPYYTLDWSPAYDRVVNNVAKEYNVEYINFDDMYNEIGIDYTFHSMDGGKHLNSYGAEIFSAYLGKYIISNYDVQSHYDDPAYQKVWEQKLIRYNNAMNN